MMRKKNRQPYSELKSFADAKRVLTKKAFSVAEGFY